MIDWVTTSLALVQAVLSDDKEAVSMPKEISKTEQVLLKVCLGPLAVLARDEVKSTLFS